MVTSKLLLLAMSMSVVLLHLGFEFISIAHIPTVTHVHHVLNHVLKYESC